MYMEAHCQIPGIESANSIGILNAHTQLRLGSKVLGLVLRKPWQPECQSSHTGGFPLAVALNGIYSTIDPMSADQQKQIGIRRGARSRQLRGGFF
jgi:hypothetical protein